MPNLSTEAQGRMSAQKDDDRYNMEHLHRGKCVIFNHESFVSSDNPASREGTIFDVHRIEETFQQLSFTIEICNDYEFSSITKKLDERKYIFNKNSYQVEIYINFVINLF